jgi:hypothetical protein
MSVVDCFRWTATKNQRVTGAAKPAVAERHQNLTPAVNNYPKQGQILTHHSLNFRHRYFIRCVFTRKRAAAALFVPPVLRSAADR